VHYKFITPFATSRLKKINKTSKNSSSNTSYKKKFGDRPPRNKLTRPSKQLRTTKCLNKDLNQGIGI